MLLTWANFPWARPMRQAWLTWVFWGRGRTPEAPERQAPHSRGAFGKLQSPTSSPPHTIGHLERSSRTSRHLKFEVFLSQRGLKFISLLLWSCQAPAGGVPGKGREGRAHLLPSPGLGTQTPASSKAVRYWRPLLGSEGIWIPAFHSYTVFLSTPM